MKYLKMLGLAAIAAAALTAFVGTGTAAAEWQFCTTNEPCPTGHATTGKMWESVLENPSAKHITANATNPVLTSNLGNVTCASSQTTLTLTATTATLNAIKGHISTVTFTSCTLKDPFGVSHACNNIHAGGFQGNVSKTSASAGTLTVENVFVKLVCPGFIECSFGGKDLKLPFTEGNPATVTANKVALEKEAGGFLCPSTSEWDATYKTTSGVFIV